MTTPGVPPMRVLLFDGECGLCQRVAGVLRGLDRHHRLSFAPLQGDAAQGFLRAHSLPTDDFDSLIYVPDWNRPPQNYLTRTHGGLQAFHDVGGVGKIISGLKIVPHGIRDSIYRVIARWRFRIFGRARLEELNDPRWSGRLLR